MSIADSFLSRNGIKGKSNESADIPEYNQISPSFARNFSPAPHLYLNPRQDEFWNEQNVHQERLNYLHFKHRLEQTNARNEYDNDFGDEFTYRNENGYTETVSTEDIIKLRRLNEEEIELEKELLRQQNLLQDTRIKIQNEIDKMQRLLEHFRKERAAEKMRLEQEYSKRKERYQTDITTIKNTELKKPQINISVIKEKSSPKTRSKMSTEISSISQISSCSSFSKDYN